MKTRKLFSKSDSQKQSCIIAGPLSWSDVKCRKFFSRVKLWRNTFFFKDNSYTSLQFLYKNKKRYAWSGSLVAYIAEGVKYFKVFQGKEGGEVLYKWICKLFETCPALLIVQIFLAKIKILINFKHKHYVNFQIHLICFPPPAVS